MPQYKKPGTGRDFKPGQSGNPKGRPKDPPELKAIKQMTRGEFSLLIHKLIGLKPEDLKDFKGTVLEMAMASAVQAAIKHGDFSKMQSFIERLFGKVPDVVNSTVETKTVNKSLSELYKELEEAMKDIRES